ncbi:protein ALP1-like [Aricia agestis]|uniref:protein ALP1-like n=1 Tax=Aricia agestis TaxID=91739 RepID=UPI001C20767D|nr:protein ALP1-like [Aricia agestis]
MDFSTKFILEMFLDDSISTVNRLIIATANVASENLENFQKYNIYEHKYIPQPMRQKYDKNESNDKKFTEKFEYYKYLRKYFTDYDYLQNFKMKMHTIQELIKYLKDFVKEDTSIVPFDKKVHIFLYAITSDLSFNKVSEKFGLHKSSVSYIFHEIAQLISEQRFHFINWPSLVKQHITRMKVNSRYGFPNCVGFIDACRFKVGSKRKRNPNSNIILLQAVCDESLMFTDIYVGEIGNSKKSKVFKESPLAKNLKKYVDMENHILGDSSYRLEDNLITPFSSVDSLSIEEIKFNETHWNSRKYIGLALQMLRDRFKKINHIDICKPQSVKTIIYAACVLHNFIMIHEGQSQLKEENNLNNYSITFDTNIVTTAAEKRQFMCNYMASFTPNVLSCTESEHAYCQQGNT